MTTTLLLKGFARRFAQIALALLATTLVRAGSPASQSDLSEWWNGPYASGMWFGAREAAEDRGIDLFGDWKGTFYGLTSGGIDGPHGAFDEQLTLGIRIDFGKLLGVEGLSGQASARYRDGRNPDLYAGASNTFNPSRYQSGQGWRMMPAFLTYTTPELFGRRHLLTLSGGWQNPYDFFADQPESKLFTNNAIGTTKGIGGNNGFPWSSSYAAWGGFFKVRPVDWAYTMAGLYLAIPEATLRPNHGLDFAGFGPDPAKNGLYFLGEAGFTPKLGSSKLPGKYAFGAIYWGIENTSFNGQVRDEKYTFYWQADQMLYREPSPSETASEGKGKATEPKLSEQGLHAFTFFNFAPQSDNALPFYFHTGLVYRGLIPTRDKDDLGVAWGYGNYSASKIHEEEQQGVTAHQNYEAVVEADYRIQIAGFAYVQPFWQYIIQPSGRGQIQNANIFGVHLGVTF